MPPERYLNNFALVCGAPNWNWRALLKYRMITKYWIRAEFSTGLTKGIERKGRETKDTSDLVEEGSSVIYGV